MRKSPDSLGRMFDFANVPICKHFDEYFSCILGNNLL